MTGIGVLVDSMASDCADEKNEFTISRMTNKNEVMKNSIQRNKSSFWGANATIANYGILLGYTWCGGGHIHIPKQHHPPFAHTSTIRGVRK